MERLALSPVPVKWNHLIQVQLNGLMLGYTERIKINRTEMYKMDRFEYAIELVLSMTDEQIINGLEIFAKEYAEYLEALSA